MAEPNKSLKEISDEVFAYLLQRHFDERAAGREFFFMLNDNFEQVRETQIPFRTDGMSISLSFWYSINSGGKEFNLGLKVSQSGTVEFSVLRDQKYSVVDLHRLIADSLKGSLHKLNSPPLKSERNVFARQYSADQGGTTKALEKFLATDYHGLNDWVRRFGANGRFLESISPAEYYRSDAFYALPIRPDHFDEMLKSVQQALEDSPKPAQTKSELPSEKILPIRLISLDIRNYKGIKHAQIDTIPAGTHWIFLTGENGFGKSSVLQAITLGIWKGYDERPLVNESDNPVINVQVGVQNDIRTMSFSQYTAPPVPVPVSAATTYRNTDELLPMAAYGSGRLLTTRTIPPDRNNYRRGAVQSLFYPEAPLYNIEFELIKSFAYKPQYFKLLRDTFCKLIPDLADIRINIDNPSNPFVEYFEKDREGHAYVSVKLSDLAAGFRNLIGFVGDMVLRLSAGQGEIENWQDLKGIVIIDELELYLHPKYQRILPGKLSELFPNVQFIASTHSPIPLLGAPKESLVLTVERNEETGVVITQPDVDFSRLLPNAILTSPIFGFDEIIPESAENMAEVETEDSYNDAQRIQRIKEKLGILKVRHSTV